MGKEYGFPMGRFEVGDLSGNDVGYRVMESTGMLQKQQPEGSPERWRGSMRYCPLADMLVEAGRCGYKSGYKGWFQYDTSTRPPTALVDPEVTKMIDDFR